MKTKYVPTPGFEFPSGLCNCGCGFLTPKRGNKYALFIPGHEGRRFFNFQIIDMGYETPCFVWLGTIKKPVSRHGYAIARVDGKARLMHRLFYERVNGEIPPDHELHHLCQIKPCVRADHVEPLTNDDHQIMDGRKKFPVEQIDYVRELRAQGLTYAQVSILSGIGREYAWQICAGGRRNQ